MEAILRTYEVPIESPKERESSKRKYKDKSTHKDCKQKIKKFMINQYQKFHLDDVHNYYH
jgi:hypothetical protein